jgi:hypothetical protein
MIGVRIPVGLEFFLFDIVSRPALGPTQPPIQWVSGALSLEVKRPGREANHSPPSSAEFKECVELNLTPQYAFMAWCLVKHRDYFTLPYLTLPLGLFSKSFLIFIHTPSTFSFHFYVVCYGCLLRPNGCIISSTLIL